MIFCVKLFLLLLLLNLLSSKLIADANAEGLIEVFSWKQLEFELDNDYKEASHTFRHRQHSTRPIVFPGPIERYGVVQSVQHPATNYDERFDEPFNAYNSVPVGVMRFQNYLFVTVPRRREGIPSTLNYIDLHLDGGKKTPKLRPFPNLHANQYKRNGLGLVSVYRLSVDECERLWFVDTGMLEYPGNFQKIKQPVIWIWDLKRGQLLHRFEIPAGIATIGRGMASITVDVSSDHCNAAFAYIPDLFNRQLHVYSFAENRMWSFNHTYFQPDDTAGNLTVAGQNFRWNDGIFSITLGPLHQHNTTANGSRVVYFHPMQSNNEFVVMNNILQSEANAAAGLQGDNQDFRLLGSLGIRKQTTMHEYDPLTGVIFYSEVNRNGVGCWNSRRDFTPENHGTVAMDDIRMIYPSDLTIDTEANLWVLTNSMPIFANAQLNTNAYNFRIWRQNTLEATRKSVCA